MNDTKTQCLGAVSAIGAAALHKEFDCGKPGCTELHRRSPVCHKGAGVVVARCPSDPNVFHVACVVCDATILNALMWGDMTPVPPGATVFPECHPNAGLSFVYDPVRRMIMLYCHECDRPVGPMLPAERVDLIKPGAAA